MPSPHPAEPTNGDNITSKPTAKLTNHNIDSIVGGTGHVITPAGGTSEPMTEVTDGLYTTKVDDETKGTSLDIETDAEKKIGVNKETQSEMRGPDDVDCACKIEDSEEKVVVDESKGDVKVTETVSFDTDKVLNVLETNIGLKCEVRNVSYMSEDKSSEVKHPLIPANVPGEPPVSPMLSQQVTSQEDRCNSALTADEKKHRRAKIKRKPLETGKVTVLNVPSLNFGPPVVKRQKLSRIDVATIRRKLRRQAKTRSKKKTMTNENGAEKCLESTESSSMSSSEEENAVDLWIRSGPPLKQDMAEEKVRFLGMFRLTTHGNKSAIELEKLKRRKWHTPHIVEIENDDTILPLSLPVPSKSPGLLNMMPDFKPKNAFFQLLGLKKVPPQVQREFERTWVKIVKERLRRNCESSLTKYTMKVHNAYLTSNKLKPNGLVDGSCDTSFKIPLVHQYAHNLKVNPKKEETRNEETWSGILEYHHVPLVKLELQNKIENRAEEDVNGFKWPGIQGVMEAYEKYSKERASEVDQLNGQCAKSRQVIAARQFEVRYLERRQRELHAALFSTEQRAKALRSAVDSLTSVIAAFR